MTIIEKRSKSKADCAPNSLELKQMQQIVPGVQPNHMFHALFTALGVHADTLQIVTRRTRQ